MIVAAQDEVVGQGGVAGLDEAVGLDKIAGLGKAAGHVSFTHIYYYLESFRNFSFSPHTLMQTTRIHYRLMVKTNNFWS